ncbi:MAG TPA: hypothetical protein VGA37_05180 [Gemmatimonadales bacterium]
MHTRNLITRSLLLSSVALCCGDDGGPANGNTEPITTGVWHGNAGTGFAFDFTINAARDAVTSVTFQWTDWKCGTSAATHSGGITSNRDPGWAITNRAIAIDADPADLTFTITGTVANNGTEASGTWNGTDVGGTCSGTWTAAP